MGREEVIYSTDKKDYIDFRIGDFNFKTYDEANEYAEKLMKKGKTSFVFSGFETIQKKRVSFLTVFVNSI